jgi:hypothetical protein
MRLGPGYPAAGQPASLARLGQPRRAAAATGFTFADVVLLVGFDGAATDESSHARAITMSGTGAIDAVNFKFGTGSLSRDATSQCFAADSADFEFGSNPFTVEGWWRWTDVSATVRALISHWNAVGNLKSWLINWTGTNLVLQVSSNGAITSTKITVVWAPTLNAWHHIACDFDGTTYRLYVDGVMIGSATGVVALFDTAAVLRIGGFNAGTSNGFLGNIDEVRIVGNHAVYGSDAGFVAPVAAFPRA